MTWGAAAAPRGGELRGRKFAVGLDLGADDDLTSPLLPGFVVPVKTLFA